METSSLKTPMVRTLCVGVALLSAVGSAQLAKGATKFVGNITQPRATTNGEPNSPFTSLWNQATAENGCKWGTVEGTEGKYNWSECDVAYNWAKKNGRIFKFHALVWGGQYPGWLKNKNVDQTRTAIEKWFDAVKAKYPDLKQIDVVNEAIRTGTNKYHSPYTETKQIDALGGDAGGNYKFVTTAFEMAHKRWPDAVLIYNDYNTFQWQINEGIDLIKKIKAAGAPVDAYGQQSHDMQNQDGTCWNFNNFKAALKKIHDGVGIPLVITEYDVSTTNDNIQKQCYQEQITEFMNADYVYGITLWGYIYGQTWTTGGYSGIIRNGSDRPAMAWLRTYLASNKGVNATKYTPASLAFGTSAVESREGSLASAVNPGLVMRKVNGRMVVGIERDGQFQEMSALGRR